MAPRRGPQVIGWQNEMLDTAQLLHRARRGCWAYPGYAIYGADARDNKTVSSATRREVI